mmetsp:Transcript_10135/g.24828  ORF Transcript_10135/g.24828 Transcript_10135/m.24828 type:complete len:205 (+) Transcript_10135:3551-4165(+)
MSPRSHMPWKKTNLNLRRRSPKNPNKMLKSSAMSAETLLLKMPLTLLTTISPATTPPKARMTCRTCWRTTSTKVLIRKTISAALLKFPLLKKTRRLTMPREFHPPRRLFLIATWQRKKCNRRKNHPSWSPRPCRHNFREITKPPLIVALIRLSVRQQKKREEATTDRSITRAPPWLRQMPICGKITTMQAREARGPKLMQPAFV